jgi:hypothetical protein
MVLFEALTGRVYRGQPPGTRPVTLRPEIPGWLDELLVHMLAEDPRLRPWDDRETAGLLRSEQDGVWTVQQAKLETENRLIEEKERQEAE